MDGDILSYTLSNSITLEIIRGDITRQKVGAIVNAANPHLVHRDGVAGAIVLRGGVIIQQQSNEWVRTKGLVDHHTPAITTAGDLPCMYVIHAVGPVWGSGDEPAKLKITVESCLKAAADLGLSSIAFPAISTGVYGFPIDLAALIMLDTIVHFTFGQSPLRLVRIILYETESYSVFSSTYRDLIERSTGTA